MSVFNGERFLAEAIESILNQTFRDFEFIIVNDGSRDRTASILERYGKSDSRVRIYAQENKGLIASLNRGCGLALGKYLARMDADDVSMPDRLDRQVRFLDHHEEVGLLGGAVEIIDDQGEWLFLVRPPLRDQTIRTALRSFSFPIFHSAVLMRKQTFDEAGGYRAQFLHAEDYDLCLRIVEHWKMANLPDVVLRKRTHSDGVSVRNLRQQSLSALAAHALSSLRERQCAEPPCDGPVISSAFVEKLGVSQASQRRHLASAYVSWIGAMLQASQHEAVQRLFEELTDLSTPGPVPESAVSTAMLSACWMHYRAGRPVRAMAALGRAFWASPVVAARPLKWKLSSLFRSRWPFR
jgi:hypothetical protein